VRGRKELLERLPPDRTTRVACRVYAESTPRRVWSSDAIDTQWKPCGLERPGPTSSDSWSPLVTKASAVNVESANDLVERRERFG
jgi:hypothetical protein